MSEGIDLPPLARGTLLSEAERVSRLDAALPQIRAALEGEREEIAVEATLACLLWETLVQTNWCGFYRRTGATTLTVGPYQGTMGCLRIDFARGVCGACARTREVQLVSDVTAFEGHIACDDRTRSELVIPIVVGGELRGVLDLDSPHRDAFSRAEADRLVALVGDVFGGVAFRDLVDPFAQLERSHRRLEERLDDLQRAGDDGEVLRDVAGFFMRAVRRHEDDEERSLFPRLASRPELAPLLERLAGEHREHEALHARLASFVQDLDERRVPAAREIEALTDALMRAYRTHIDDEEKVLFPAARKALEASELEAIAREMEARRGGGGGGGGGRGRA